jgi:hypothetical protein
MSTATKDERSFERITIADLSHLAELGMNDFAGLFERSPYSRPYRDRLILMCLCQGAARHYVHRDRGVNDFDVWGFFRRLPGRPFPYRRRGTQDFGPSRFGRNIESGFGGRRVDVIGRSIEVGRSESAIHAVQRYLDEGRTDSAHLLSLRPAIALWPAENLGRVIWEGR